MSDIVIRVDHLSKRYVLNHQRSGDGLRHVLQDRLAAPWRALAKKLKSGKQKAENVSEGNNLSVSASQDFSVSRSEEFWALKDVSFEVKRGEVVGIIGRNGAGKSTLLKILSRITEPTSGQIEIDGRVASLLEVGTGFHPELTGRENIFLNGAILGMKRSEIRRKFDEIVTFAEVEKFLDTPVKRYSSGMYVRLAFAVAAHLEPEILIVDEVLAVGDVQFQKKCLGKMKEVSQAQGRTILFVSHNMAAISSLTNQCIYLKAGEIATAGFTAPVVMSYMRESVNKAGTWVAEKRSLHPVQIVRASLYDDGGENRTTFQDGEPIVVEIETEVRQPSTGVFVEIWVYNNDGIQVLTAADYDTHPDLLEMRRPGRMCCRFRIPPGLLNFQGYTVRINSSLNTLTTYDHRDVLSFEILDNRSSSAQNGRRAVISSLIPCEIALR